jgi:hypothetical protein
MQHGCGTPLDISYSTETNSMSHSHARAQPAWSLCKTSLHFGGCVFSPQRTGDPSPAPSCFPQVAPHGLVVGVIIRYQPPQVLENFDPFQVLPARTKRAFEGLLGACSSLMLAFPLPSPLTQLCVEMASGEVLCRRLQSTTCALRQGEGTLDWNANKILGMSHKKMPA